MPAPQQKPHGYYLCKGCYQDTQEAITQMHGEYIHGHWCSQCKRFTFFEKHSGVESLLPYPAFIFLRADHK